MYGTRMWKSELNLIRNILKKLLVTQMVTKFHHNMETECSFPCSQQPAIGLRASMAIFTSSLKYITFNSIRYLRSCPGLNFLRISNVKHCMIHDLHISYDLISSPVFVPHQLQHSNLFHAFTTLPY